MRWFEWAIFAIAVVYVGNVLGCMILCETIPQIETARKYSWIVPVLACMLFFSYLFEALGGRGFVLLWKYIKMPQKNIFILGAITQLAKRTVVEEHQCRQPIDRRESQKEQIVVVRGLFRNLAAATTTIII